MDEQSQFQFGTNASEAGYSKWLAARRLATHEVARRMNLPVGHEVEVWLLGEIRLRGKLELQEEVLFIVEERVRHLELVIGHVRFTYREMQSCVRLD